MRWSLSELRYAWKFYTPANFKYFFKELPIRWRKRIKLVFQWLFTGQTEQSVYSLDDYLAIVIAQRLKLFRKHNVNTYFFSPEDGINTPEDWKQVIEKMIDGFEYYAAEHYNTDDFDQFLEALELFKKHFCDLWD